MEKNKKILYNRKKQKGEYDNLKSYNKKIWKEPELQGLSL